MTARARENRRLQELAEQARFDVELVLSSKDIVEAALALEGRARAFGNHPRAAACRAIRERLLTAALETVVAEQVA